MRGDTEYRRRTKVNSTYKGGVWITQPDEEWTRGGRIGLNMSVVEEKKRLGCCLKLVLSSIQSLINFKGSN